MLELFLNNPLLMSLAFAVLLIIAAVAGVYLYKYLKSGVQGYPGEEALEKALLPYLYNAIMFAYKASEAAIDASQERLDGIDKKMLADAVYNMLPEFLYIGTVAVPLNFLKTVVTRERFSELVQLAFDEFMRFYATAEANLKAELEAALGA